ncbi:hypothetical protein GOODEAATRI_005096, partial [Goodea atripinnis]
LLSVWPAPRVYLAYLVFRSRTWQIYVWQGVGSMKEVGEVSGPRSPLSPTDRCLGLNTLFRAAEFFTLGLISGVSTLRSKAKDDELVKPRGSTPFELSNNDLLSLDPLSSASGVGSSSSVSSTADLASVFFPIPPSPSFLMNDCEVFLPEAPVDTMPPKGHFTPVAERQQSKDVSSFSSSTTSPWDSPENTSQALKPAPLRAQSAPITQPNELIDPIKSPTTACPPKTPKSVDGFSSISWSQSQWIAFGDNCAPPCHHGSGSSVAEVQRVQAGFGRSRRFLSDDSADASCKTTAAAVREDSRVCFTDVFSDRTVAAATASTIFNGNSYADI